MAASVVSEAFAVKPESRRIMLHKALYLIVFFTKTAGDNGSGANYATKYLPVSLNPAITGD
jgi:hypothetical protein